MRSRADIEGRAVELGARPETVEKVLTLLELLTRLDRHELTRGWWALKGGTALNVFYLDLPRLSVDIDINFLGAMGPADLAGHRARFERGLRACCERAGCSVRRIAPDHAGGKVALQFASRFGGTQKLEVDVNYVLRTALLDLDRRRPTHSIAGDAVPIPVLAFPEIAAGKFCAMLQRQEPRDHYDALRLLELDPRLAEHPDLRLAFVVLAACQRSDFRSLSGLPAFPSEESVRQRLDPILRRVDGDLPDAVEILRFGRDRLEDLARRLLDWSRGERAFLGRLLDEGELEPELLTKDATRQERVRGLPMLRWKLGHVRRHLGLDPSP